MDRSLALPLIDRIYAAALEPPRWQDFVQALSDAFGGAPVGYAMQLPGFPLSGVFFASRGFDDDYLEPFATFWAVQGLPWEEARSRNFVGRFGLATEVTTERQIRDSDFFRDWMQPQGLAAHGPMGHTIMVDGERPSTSIAIFAREEDEPFGAEQLAFADALVPHLERGVGLQAASRRFAALSAAIDRFPTGLALLDARGQVLHANHAAQQIFGADDGLALKDGRVHAAQPADDTALRELIARAVERASTEAMTDVDVISVTRRSARRPLPVMATALHPTEGRATLADAVAVLFVADFHGGVLHRSGVLRKLYGLTEAESHLVELLCQGSSLEEAAEIRGVTMNTARSQLKHAFAKTNTSRQSELVRLVLSGVASIGAA